jgi:ABC-2 type transport system permease protein
VIAHPDTLAPGGSVGAVSAALSRRALVAITRVPSAFVPSVVFPVFVTIAFSGAFGAITNLPFFPTDDALSWFAPLAAIQGAGFAGLFSAFGVIRDFEDGFMDRLLLAPTPRKALLAGPLLTAALRSVVPVFAALLVGVIGGMAVPGGFLGIVSLFVAALGVAVLAACWSLGLAFRIRSMRAAPLMQVGLFFAIFLSSSQMPIEGLAGWLETVARINPFTYILDMGRQGFVGEVALDTTLKGLGAIAATGPVLGLFAWRGLAKLDD